MLLWVLSERTRPPRKCSKGGREQISGMPGPAWPCLPFGTTVVCSGVHAVTPDDASTEIQNVSLGFVELLFSHGLEALAVGVMQWMIGPSIFTMA